MLFLLFQLGKDRYALDAGQIIEVLPLLALKEVPQSPKGIAGLFSYHGVLVPVVDVCETLLSRPAHPALSTRLVLVRHPDGSGGERLLGFIVEKATGTIQLDPTDFSDSGVANDGTPCLGPVVVDPKGLIQWIEPQKLLSESVRDALFRQIAEADNP